MLHVFAAPILRPSTKWWLRSTNTCILPLLNERLSINSGKSLATSKDVHPVYRLIIAVSPKSLATSPSCICVRRPICETVGKKHRHMHPLVAERVPIYRLISSKSLATSKEVHPAFASVDPFASQTVGKKHRHIHSAAIY